MAMSIMEQPNAKNFNQIKKAVEVLNEQNAGLSARLDLSEKENQLLKEAIGEVDAELKNISNTINKYYGKISKDIQSLSSQTNKLAEAVELVSSNQKNHDLLNYDIMKKMLTAQESMFQSVVALLETHSIISEADNAINYAVEADNDDITDKMRLEAFTEEDYEVEAGNDDITDKTATVKSLVGDRKDDNNDDFMTAASSFYTKLKRAFVSESEHKISNNDNEISYSEKYELKLKILQLMRAFLPHGASSLDQIEERINEISKSPKKFKKFLDALEQDPVQTLKSWGFGNL